MTAAMMARQGAEVRLSRNTVSLRTRPAHEVVTAKNARGHLRDLLRTGAEVHPLSIREVVELNRTSTRDIRQVFLRLSGFAFGLIALGLIACSTPSLKLAPSPDCGSMDWFEIGRIDGSQGEPLLTFNRHIELCAGSTTPPSRDHYVAGREAGLTEFCTPTSGLEAGKLGESYSNVCPSHLERTFLSAFAIGTKIRALENENREVETRIAALIDQLARAKAGNTELETRLDELRRRRAQIESRISEIESTFFTSP